MTRLARYISLFLMIAGVCSATMILNTGVEAKPMNISELADGSPIEHLNSDNFTVLKPPLPLNYRQSPQPVTLFRMVLNETSLPGPRYMAFGPSVIGMVVDPYSLAIFLFLIAATVGVWYFLGRRHAGGRDDEG